MENKIDNWAEILPRGAAKKIKEILNTKLSERSIQRILTGEIEDHHDVLSVAASIAKIHQKEKERLNKEFALLKLKAAHSLKQNKNGQPAKSAGRHNVYLRSENNTGPSNKFGYLQTPKKTS